MQKEKTIAALVILTLAGCVSTAPIKPEFVAQNVGNADRDRLCNDVYQSQNAIAVDELRRRGVLSEMDAKAIEVRRALIGISALGAQCLFGMPSKINDTVTAGRTVEQWVYCANYMYSPQMRKLGQPSFFSSPELEYEACGEPAYLYFENGRLTATQNTPPPPLPR